MRLGCRFRISANCSQIRKMNDGAGGQRLISTVRKMLRIGSNDGANQIVSSYRGVRINQPGGFANIFTGQDLPHHSRSGRILRG